MKPGKPEGSIEPPLTDFESACLRIRAAVEPLRVQAVSLHDRTGDLLFLTESSMGPDEHDAVRQAFESYADPASPVAQAFDLGDGRSAVLFRVTGPDRALRGAAMIIVDTRVVGRDSRGAASLMTPKLMHALSSISASLAARNATPAPVSAAPTSSAPDRGVGVDPVPAEIDRLHAALRRASLALHVQRLVPLAKGSRFARYEVLLRMSGDAARGAAPQAMLRAAVEQGFGSMIDRRVLTELIAWLKRHPAAWLDHGALFSVNLTRTALHDEHFLKFVELCLAKAELPRGTVGFEVGAADAIRYADRFAAVADSLSRLGCPIVLDDFGLRTEYIELLRAPGVQVIKLAHEITAKMRVDKLSQAAITALVQMARVLGMHTVAKRAELQTEREWLSALGVDFIQSNAFAPPLPIDALDDASTR